MFPERSYRRAEERLQHEYSTKLEQSGGCKGAKQAGMPNRLRAHYDDLIREHRATAMSYDRSRSLLGSNIPFAPTDTPILENAR